jgi:hypothetical protein
MPNARTQDEEGSQEPFLVTDDKCDQGKLLFKHIVK